MAQQLDAGFPSAGGFKLQLKYLSYQYFLTATACSSSIADYRISLWEEGSITTEKYS